jgi:uncharacterized repeat protein (TIGR01451 family)
MRKKNRFLRDKRFVALAVSAVLVMLPSISMAATNTGTGDVGGTALTPGSFDLSAQQLALFKRAFLESTGNALNDGDTLPSGTAVQFMIYLNNDTDIAATDVSVQDVLPAAFVYDNAVDSIKVGTVASSTCALPTCTAGEEKTIFDTINGLGALTNGPGDDAVSYTVATTTIDAGDGSETTNTQVDVAADTIWAMVFTVTMQ